LEAARILLSNGHSLKEIAAQVGYLSPARLTVAFERRLGLAPRLFREMHAGM
jgi:AraC-like DNA-binding protein